ncbi:MAG: hypothetical protein AUK54_08770 [Helicobacteraceae bacterium CG2_30_36_10]|nr:MAG: hypothetical protein AUK54_08770 [Helicobacteraceae bacterium CG2_30_36_10]
MSTKRKTYSAEFKAKLVLEVLEGEKTVNEIASAYEIIPKNLINWKQQFLENMSLAFDKSAVVKEYKEQIETLQKSNDCNDSYLVNNDGQFAINGDPTEGALVVSALKGGRVANISF